MNHQVLQPFSDEWTTAFVKAHRPQSEILNRQSLLSSRSAGLKIAVSSGVLVCSAMAIYSWAQPFVSEPDSQDGEAAAQVPGAKQSQAAQKPASSAAPERLSNPEWSDRQSEKLPDQMEAMYGDLLKQAQASASRDQIADAMNGISGIPKNSRHYEMAQRLQEDWSRELLRQATNYCRQAKVETAVSMLSTIPATSQLHDRVTELRQRWSKQAKVLDQAIAAKDAEDWQQAISAIKSLEGSPMYHSLPVQELLQQAMTNLYEPEESLTEIATSDLPAVELSDELQQPDQVLVEIATQDLPTVQPSITPPEKISVSPAPTQQAF